VGWTVAGMEEEDGGLVAEEEELFEGKKDDITEGKI
jgi:hypothetical protein